jgi:hypothetical protein
VSTLITLETVVTDKAKRPDPLVAKRALQEAESRREKQKQIERELARREELHGRKGPDPTRYGDWENKGIISDF